MVLVILPGTPPYFIILASIMTKIYSNSMMAMLNSRVKLVSNVPSFATPLWNELVNTRSSFGTQGIEFRRDSETGLTGSSRDSGMAPP